ncbi:MAG: hypothetical protein AMXMBFR23_11160 [Chloroflexota bacterium]
MVGQPSEPRPPTAAGDGAASEPVDALVLLLLAEPASSAEVVQRVRTLAASLDESTTAAALRRLGDLGLVRLASTEGSVPSYTRTTLGRDYGPGAILDRPDVATRLAELEELRTDFVATIAHELKTPLTAIRTCVGLLIDSNAQTSDDIRQRLLDRVSASAEGMQHLIESLLDLARYRAGRLQMERRWVDANEVARDAVDLVAPLVQARGQAVHLDVVPESPAVYADRRRLVQALGNIVSNAQKFSPDGAAIEVSVRQQGDVVVWEVRDHGPGISPDDQRHLFERFFRGRSDIEGGSGLGLPIALATVQAHGGSIDVESEVGRGSTFRVTVPRGEGAAGSEQT